jgi:hypothetical protein
VPGGFWVDDGFWVAEAVTRAFEGWSRHMQPTEQGRRQANRNDDRRDSGDFQNTDAERSRQGNSQEQYTALRGRGADQQERHTAACTSCFLHELVSSEFSLRANELSRVAQQIGHDRGSLVSFGVG